MLAHSAWLRSMAENYLWQSFDYPTDTLPGMKLGWDSKSGRNRFLTSWKSTGDPSSGDYSFRLDTSGFPEIYMMNKQVIVYRSGPWNGLRFSGVPEMKASPLLSFTFTAGPDEISYSFKVNEKSVYSRLVMKPTRNLDSFIWVLSSEIWNLYWYAPKDQCDGYNQLRSMAPADFLAGFPMKSTVRLVVAGEIFSASRHRLAWWAEDGSG